MNNKQNETLTRLTTLLEERGLNRQDLTRLNPKLSAQTISNAFRKNSVFEHATILEICKALDITVSQFYDEDERIVTDTQYKHLKEYIKLSSDDRDIVDGLIQMMLDKQTKAYRLKQEKNKNNPET